jgi:hypothetical protein
VVVGQQSSRPILNIDYGNSLELLENRVGAMRLEGWNLEGMKVNYVNRDGFDPSVVAVSYLAEENKGSEMLDIHPHAAIREQRGSYLVSSNWVVEMVIFFGHVVGMSCEVFEDQSMALCTAIEANWHQNGVGSVPDLSGKTRNKRNRELKRLTCSMNYDVRGVHSH